MKHAWEVYFESVEDEVFPRTMLESPFDPESDESRAFVAAFETARVSTADFLVRDEGWSRTAAAWLTEEFVKSSLNWLENAQELGLAGLKVLVRHRYEDWLRQ